MDKDKEIYQCIKKWLSLFMFYTISMHFCTDLKYLFDSMKHTNLVDGVSALIYEL